MAHDAPNDGDNPRRLRVRSWLTLGLTTLGVVFLEVGLLVALPLLDRYCAERSARLPAATAGLFKVSWLAALFIVACWVSLLVKELANLPRGLTLLLNCLSLMAVAGLACALLVTLGLPLIEYQKGLSK